jgi:hypothetical protein
MVEIAETIIRDEIDITDGLDGITLTGQLEVFRQIVAHRALDLVQGMVRAWNSGSMIGAAVCGRALLETLGTFHAVMTRCQAAATANDWGEVATVVDTYLFSTSRGRGKRSNAHPRPPRIGDLVVSFIGATQPGSEQFWEQLCDLAHPNGQSTTHLFFTVSATGVVAREPKEREPDVFVAIYNCAYSLCWFYNAMDEFDLLLDHIRLGEAPPDDNPLKTKLAERDRIVAAVLPSLKKVRIGPARRTSPRRG